MKLGVIAAMKIEAEIIIAKMTDKKTESLGGIEYTTGKIGDCTVICSVCGIGKVFAGMCAQGMIIGFSPDYIINTGVAGTLDSSLSIGDIAVSSAVVQHDMDTSGIGDPPGLISGINMIEMPASEFLGSLISDIAKKRGIKCVTGIIASGDQFIADGNAKKRIRKSFGAVACEMEGGAVGQVCTVNEVPFVVIRAISDDADSGAVEDYPSFAKKSAEISADITVKLAEELLLHDNPGNQKLSL